MRKILFICHGNICRSPMAEMFMKELVRREHLENEFFIDSAATTREEIGNGMHRGTRKVLELHGIPFTNHRARLVTMDDYNDFDFIVYMDEENRSHLEYILGDDTERKFYKLLDFCGIHRDVADPWYTGNFDETYEDVVAGCTAFLKFLRG